MDLNVGLDSSHYAIYSNLKNDTMNEPHFKNERPLKKSIDTYHEKGDEIGICEVSTTPVRATGIVR